MNIKAKLRKLISILGYILLILIFIILISLFGPRIIFRYEHGFFYGYNLILEYKFSKALAKANQTNDLVPIKLQEFSNKKIIKACIQSPYIIQPFFEELVGEKLNNFRETSDIDGEVLWLFFFDGSISRVRLPYYWEKAQCTKKNLTISFKINEKLPGGVNFFFNEDN